MLTGERRGVRRGMTVLGKIPAVPKPINLPSQRLENRGLDPNVELVPRGTVTWGNSARSPPTTSSPWGSSSQPSSPPVSAGAWGNTSSKPVPAAWGPNSTRPSSAGSTRPTSAGGTRPLSSGGPRPSSAGSRHLQDLPRPSSAGTGEIPHTQNAWASLNSRPSSASGLGQPNSQPAETRPRSAESRSNSRVSLLSSEFSNAVQPWGPAARKLPEELPQPSRFTLTTGDFPTLGSEKNPSLRPQQRDRPGHADDRSLTHEERPPPPSSAGSYQDDPYSQGSRLHDGDTGNAWGRDPFRGPPGMIERDGNFCMPPASSNSWRREGPHDLPEDDHWRGPPGGPYGPAGPPRFPNPEFVHQRFGPGPGSYGRGGHGQPGDGYGGPSPFMRPMTPDRPGHHFGPGMFPGPYDGYYGYPGPNYNMEDREMMMWGGPGRYGGFQPGPPDFARHPHGGMGPRPRQMPGHTGFGKDSEGFHSDHRDAGKLKEGENAGDRTDGHTEFRRLQGGEPMNKHVVNEPKRHMYGRPYGQRDWGNEEPMDFSKPVFEKEPSNNSSSKNHKVTFKAEPSVADVAILKKPQTIKAKTDDEDQGRVGMDHLGHTEDKSRDNEESNKGEEVRAVSNESIDKDKSSSRVDDAKDPGKLVEEKNMPDMSAGVLGKAPSTALANNEIQGSSAPSHVNNASKGLGDGTKHATEHIALAAPHEQPVKEGFKSKSKPVVHELEKEWRPKVQIADSKVMALKPSQSELPSPSPSAQESGDFENAADVYDYEAQRAKMKEIAAQRARQLQKEEEERTKEQKAKALAKLEELNRKSAAISTDVLAPSTPGETEEVLGEKGSGDQLVQSDEVQSGTNVQEVKSSVGPPSNLSTKAEHGKRGNSRNREERSKSHQRKEPTMKNQDCAGENRTEPPLLPSPGVCQTQQQQEESRTAKPDVPQAPQTQQKQPRQRGKQHVLTAKGPEDVKLESPVAREQVEPFSSLDTAAIDSDSAEIRAVNTSSVEPTTGNGPRRKKSNRSGKNRQKNEAATSGLEKSSSGELHEESSIIQPVGVKALEKVATGMSSHSEGGESITIEPADPAESVTLPEETSSSRGNGERLSRKYQRKFQASKRTSKPQDVRVSDKAHAGEGMVWAPVRPNSGGVKNEGGPDLNEEKKHGSGSQQPTKSRRAEMERYTPKPVIKQQGQPQHAEKGHEENDDPSHEKHARAVEGQGPEAYHKPGRGHVSWRQRSGSDRGAKDASESNENRPPVNGSSKGLQQQRHEPEKFTQEQQSPKSATASGVAEKFPSQAPPGRPNRSYPRQDHRFSNSPGMRKFDRSEDVLPQNSGRLFSSEGSRNKSGKQQHNPQQGPHWQPNDLQTQHDAVASRSPNGPGRRQQQTDESGPPEILHVPVFRSHDKERQRENGMVYQQKSGSRQSQDIYQQEKVSENHQKFLHQQGGPGYAQKTSATDVHKSQAQYQPVSQHPKSQGNSESWSSKADHTNAHWGGDVKDGRSRESGHSRRGRFGGRGGMRSVDLGNRVEKQRMVIDATGGAVPSQVVG